jgi:vacuolar-type H+-ATPase subunit I/STV1
MGRIPGGMTPIFFAPYALLIALLGLALMCLAPEKNPNAKEFGKALMYAGLFAFCFALSHKGITIG